MIEAEYQEFELTEIARRLASIVRLGIVAEVDHQAARVRVRYGETALSRWLPWVTARAGEDRSWWAPEVGEQVLILAPSGDLGAGVVLAGVYQRGYPAPEQSPDKHATHYRDGAVIEYDRAAHRLKAVLPTGGTAEITAPDGVTVRGDLMVTGDLDVTGAAEVAGDITGHADIGADGDVSADGNIEDGLGSMDEMRGVYNTHTHGVPPGIVVPVPNQRMT